MPRRGRPRAMREHCASRPSPSNLAALINGRLQVNKKSYQLKSSLNHVVPIVSPKSSSDCAPRPTRHIQGGHIEGARATTQKPCTWGTAGPEIVDPGATVSSGFSEFGPWCPSTAATIAAAIAAIAVDLSEFGYVSPFARGPTNPCLPNKDFPDRAAANLDMKILAGRTKISVDVVKRPTIINAAETRPRQRSFSAATRGRVQGGRARPRGVPGFFSGSLSVDFHVATAVGAHFGGHRGKPVLSGRRTHPVRNCAVHRDVDQ